LALAQGFHCIRVCQPASHPTLYERVACWHANDGIVAWESRHGHGRVTAGSMSRLLHDVLRLDGQEAWAVPWFDLTVGNATTGAQRSPHSLLTNHRVTAEHVAGVAHAGRGRWKIAQENTQVLKPKGDHVEHTFGHGQQSLSAVLLSLNLLAFLFHPVLEGREDT